MKTGDKFALKRDNAGFHKGQVGTLQITSNSHIVQLNKTDTMVFDDDDVRLREQMILSFFDKIPERGTSARERQDGIIYKTTAGFVTQVYNTNTKKYMKQYFIGSEDDVLYEDVNSEPVDEPEDMPHLPFYMVKPNE